jgi:hypothetical protein
MNTPAKRFEALHTSAVRRYSRIKTKANRALSDALSPIGHPADFIEFDRLAEHQQLAALNVQAIENLKAQGHG